MFVDETPKRLWMRVTTLEDMMTLYIFLSIILGIAVYIIEQSIRDVVILLKRQIDMLEEIKNNLDEMGLKVSDIEFNTNSQKQANYEEHLASIDRIKP